MLARLVGFVQLVNHVRSGCHCCQRAIKRLDVVLQHVEFLRLLLAFRLARNWNGDFRAGV
jgi:hypothetical protein